MSRGLAMAAAIALVCFGSLAQAIMIDTVTVGNPGNQPDTRYGGSYGSVGYAYRMGKFEVTAGQYTDFLNKVAATDIYGLYNTAMWSGSYPCKIQRSGSSGSYTYSVAADWANRPVNVVNYWAASRFANWLHNGQPTGLQSSLTTERGAYTLDGYNGYDGRTIQRNPGARWFLPSEDEWYKAAYYDPNKQGGAGYWDYPTQSNVTPSNVLGDPTDPGNNATYNNNGYTIGSPYYRTEVGAHENSESAYGTYDQGGNVSEWNEAIVQQNATYVWRGLRGGSYEMSTGLGASYRSLSIVSNSYYYTGFRVAEAVPEPSSPIVLGSGVLALAGFMRRKR